MAEERIPVSPKMIFLAGMINDAEAYKQKCGKEGVPAEKCILLFPGNPRHHRKKVKLYTVKTGGGLADLARSLGKANMPTLSLPTTWVEYGDPSVLNGIKDIGRVVGYGGFYFALPVRKKVNSRYFREAIISINEVSYEPSFWGGIQNDPNLLLGNYYLKFLKLLKIYCESAEKEKETTLSHLRKEFPPFFEGYLLGCQERENVNAAWYKPLSFVSCGDVGEEEPLLEKKSERKSCWDWCCLGRRRKGNHNESDADMSTGHEVRLPSVIKHS